VQTLQRGEAMSVEVATDECAHHWVIDWEQGIDSPARCKRCGSERRFNNAHQDKTWRVANCAKCHYSRSSFNHRKVCGIE